MDSEFINAYIERMANELAELTKTRLLLETQLKLTTTKYNELQLQYSQLQTQNEKLEASLNKRASKQKEDF